MRKGSHVSAEVRLKLSIAGKEFWSDPKRSSGHRRRLSARDRTSAACKMSALHKNPEWQAKTSAAISAAWTPKRRAEWSARMMGHSVSIATREKLSKHWLEFYAVHPELKETVSKRQAKWFRDHPIKAKRIIQSLVNGVCNRPNDDELTIWGILKKHFPGRFILNCSDKGKHIWIGGKIPDFVCHGKKIVVEFFGRHWHGEERKGRTRKQEEQFYRRHYRRYGYKVVIFWTEELMHTRSVVVKHVVTKIKAALAAGG